MIRDNFGISYSDMMDVFDAIDVGVLIANHKGVIIGVNDPFEKVTTITREEIVGRDVDYLLAEGYFSTSVCQKVMRELKPVTCIINYKGKTEDVIVTGNPVFNEKGQIRFIVCTLRDWDELTEVYKELQSIKQQSEEYKQRFHNLTLQHLEDQEFIAQDRRTKTMLQMAMRIAKVDATVLILGDCGVGKDMLARIIHKHSSRVQKGSFVHVNCGAIPDALFESELFGYSAGAFTGANRTGKPGLFEIADDGTLFLDEIAELPLCMQAKLLKVLQEKTIMRVGDTKEKKIDVKVIAATNRKLEELVAQGDFRQDLYYRLNVFQLNIPSLRERKEDILPLSAFFMNKFNRKYNQNKTLSAEAIEAFVNYNWPGNVRELEHLVERIMVLCPDQIIKTEHLPKQFADNSLVSEAIRLSSNLTLKAILEKIEKAVVLDSIRKTQTLEDAAKQLGIDISTLTRKKQKYRVSKKGAVMHLLDAE